MKAFAILVLVLFAIPVFAQTSSEFQKGLDQVPKAERARFAERAAWIFSSIRRSELVQPTDYRSHNYSSETTIDQTPRGFMCVSVQAGSYFLVGGRYLSCVTWYRESFVLTTFGIMTRLGLATGYAFGQIKGPPRSGVHAIESGAGGYVIAGGSHLSAGPLSFWEFGYGLEFHSDGDTPEESMFGGQLVITPSKP